MNNQDMPNNFFDTLPVSRKQLRIFLCTFLAMFIMVCLQHLGVHAPANPMKLVMPIPEDKETTETGAMKTIRPLLEAVPNTFVLKNPTSPFFSPAHASSVLDSAASYAVIDLDTGEVIAAKEGATRLPIASITKTMTAVVSLDLADKSELYTVSEHAASIEPTKIGVVPGERMTLEELLNGLMLVSGNDAAEVIKEGVDAKYNEQIFIKAMNEKAKILGLKNTHFSNPQGFDSPRNYSSVEDLAVLTHYALNNYPEIAAIVAKDYYFLPANENHKQFDMYNWNGLIGVYPNAQGLKIGNTDEAGKTTVVTSVRGGKRMAAIVLGAPRILERDLWAAQLLDLGYERTLGLKPVNVTEEQLGKKYSSWKYWN